MVRIEKAGRGRKLKRRISALPWHPLRLRHPSSVIRVAIHPVTGFPSRVTRSIEVKRKRKQRRTKIMSSEGHPNFGPICNCHSSLSVLYLASFMR